MSARLAGGPTERQAEALRIFRETGSKAETAKRLQISERNVHNLLRRAERREAFEAEQPEGVTAILDAMQAHGADTVWLKTKEASVQWRRPKAEQDPDALLEALRGGLTDVRAAPIEKAAQEPSGLMAVFPVADLHMGLKTEAEEVGAEWSIATSVTTFAGTFRRLVEMTPAADVAVFAGLGDILHSNDQSNQTPASKHQLDVDGRFFQSLRAAVAAAKDAIEVLRAKYGRVIVTIRRGNHDPSACYAVTLALAEYYRDAPDVTVVENANEFHVEEFGRNMVLLHHGDRAHPDRLVHFAAAQWPEVWGRTRHRLALSGHVHHATKKEVGGMTFESVGTIIPRDPYSYSHGYYGKRELVSITLDSVQGEVSRARVGVS